MKERIDSLISLEELNQLFCEDLIEGFSEKELRAYVVNLIKQQKEHAPNALEILLKTATLDPFNEARNFWIIYLAFQVAPFNAKQGLKRLKVFHGINYLANRDEKTRNISFEQYIPQAGLIYQFLLDLRNCIPQSPFLWFYWQSCFNPPEIDGWEGWFQLFKTYNPDTINQTVEALNPNFILKWLAFRPMVNAALLEYLKGNYKKAFIDCSQILEVNKDQLPEGQFDLVSNLLAICHAKFDLKDLVEMLPGTHGKLLSAVLKEFESANYEELIQIVEKVCSDPQELKSYTRMESNFLYDMSAQSQERLHNRVQALALYETVYPKLLCNPEFDFGQSERTLQAIEFLQGKVKSKATNSDLFKQPNPWVLYREGLAFAEQNSEKAYYLIDEALAFFIAQKGLISLECFNCYYQIALALIDLGNPERALIKCNMAYAIASQIEHPELSTVEMQLRELELTCAINCYGEFSMESAKAYENLGLISGKEGFDKDAQEAFAAAREIYSQLLNGDALELQGVLVRLAELNIVASLGGQ